MTIWDRAGATDELRRLYAVTPTLSASEIAAAFQIKFNCYLSRCAIIGKLRRLGISDPTRIGRPPKPKAPRPERRERFKTNSTKRPRTDDRHVTEADRSEPQATDLPPDQSDCAVTFMQLEAHHCRFPVSGEGADTMFCGAGRDDTASYCARHCRIAYNKPPALKHRPYREGRGRAA